MTERKKWCWFCDYPNKPCPWNCAEQEGQLSLDWDNDPHEETTDDSTD